MATPKKLTVRRTKSDRMENIHGRKRLTEAIPPEGVDLSQIPEREQWLWKNPEALASVKRGLKQAAEGQGRSLGSFSQYADLDIDDD